MIAYESVLKVKVISICIAPIHEGAHVTHWRGISQFYLHTLHFIYISVDCFVSFEILYYHKICL